MRPGYERSEVEFKDMAKELTHKGGQPFGEVSE